jgi:hypothetical protein
MYLFVDVNPLYAAAALARVEDRAIDDLLRSPFDINVCSYICGILTS